MILRFLEGTRAGQIVNIPDTGLVIGRDETSDLKLDGEKISRQHATLRHEGYGYVIMDQQSTNGVYVNGEKVSTRRTLMNGDRLRVGDHLMLFTDERDVLPADEVQRLAQAKQARPTGGGGRAALVVVTVLIGVAAIALLVWQLLKPVTPPTSTTSGDANAFANHHDTPATTMDPYRLTPGTSALPSAPASSSAVRSGTGGSATSPGGTATSATVGTTPRDGSANAAAPAPVRDVWIQSEPVGATVTLDNVELGRTPLLARHLADGAHELRLELDGHQPLARQFFVPFVGDYPMYTLDIAPRVARIDSEPSNVSVFMGTQLLGRTPFYLMGWPVGKYELRLAATGLQTTSVQVEIVGHKGTRVRQVVPRAVGELAVSSLPPNAEVLVDGVSMGTTEAGDDPRAASLPLRIPRLFPGPRVITIRYAGLNSGEYKAVVQPGSSTSVEPAIWLPNLRLTLDDGKIPSGMLRTREEDGDVVLAISPTKTVTIPLARIRLQESRTFDESFNVGGEWPK